MFFENLEKSTGAILENVKLANIGIKEFTNALKQSLNPRETLDDAALINEATAKMTRTVLGQGRAITNQIQKTIANARTETLKFGADTKDNLELFQSINTQLQNTRFLTEDQIISMQALKHTAGLTAEEMGKFVVGFDTLGIGIDDTVSKISELQGEARSYGLNVGQFMKSVGENIKLLASYNFKGGVDGLAKMVAQAQSLRIDMSKTVSFAESLMDPDKAIEVAAGFQMLGGAVGALGDPFQLLHMAQTDMAGLQTSLVDMAAGAVDFNKETGEFNIPVTEMYRLREAAKLAGYSYQEFSEMALNSAKKTQKLELLQGIQNVPEEYREMVANLSQFDGGELKIKLPGQDDMVNVQELTATQMEQLNDMQKEMNKSDKQLAIEANGYLQQIAMGTYAMESIPEAEVLQSGKFVETVEKMLTNFDKINNRAMNYLENDVDASRGFDMVGKLEFPPLTDEQLDGFFSNVSKATDKLLDGIEKELEDFNINKFFSDIVDSAGRAWDDINDRLGRTNPQRDVPESSTTEPPSTQPSVPNRDVVVPEPPSVPNRDVVVPEPISAPEREVIVNTTTASLYTPTIGNIPLQLTVSGNVNLNLDGIPTNSTISQEALANLLTRNPQAMAIIESQLNNSLNVYG